jgi:chromosome segregation ATPase
MFDDLNCHCGPCTTMNEPLTLEGDIRYLKAHIESKDRQLADANLRINIYKEGWQDAERAAAKLDEKNAQLLTRITELEDTVVRLTKDNGLLRKEKEILIGDRTSLVGEADELYATIGRIKTIIDEIVD